VIPDRRRAGNGLGHVAVLVDGIGGADVGEGSGTDIRQEALLVIDKVLDERSGALRGRWCPGREGTCRGDGGSQKKERGGGGGGGTTAKQADHRHER